MNRRRAFTFLPLVVLLGVSLAALGIAVSLNKSHRSTGNAAYDQSNRFGSLIGPPIIALFFIWLASRVAERRSEGMANAIFGTILLLMNVAYGISLYRVLNGIPQPAIAKRNNPAAPSPPPFPYGVQPPAPPPPAPPTPTVPSGPSQQPAPPSTSTTPGPRPNPPTPAGPSPHQIAAEQADAKAKPIIEAFKTKLLEEIRTPAEAAAGFTKDIAKPPAHDKRVLKERTANAEALRNALAKLESRLKTATDDLERELAGAGLDHFDARHRAVRWSSDFSISQREFAVGRVIDLCDRVKSECAALDQDFGAWTLTKGEITVRDPKKRHALTTERFFIEAEVPRLSTTLTTLREGR